MEKAIKPLKPKYFKSPFGIKRFLETYYFANFLIIGSKTFVSIKAKCLRNAKKQFRQVMENEKILTTKKLK